MLEIVPVRDSNKDLPGETSVKIPARNSIRHFLTYIFSNSSNSGLEQRIPKWNFIESSSWRFDLLLPIPGFGYSLNSGLGQKHPEWNFTESSAWGSTKYFQSKTLSKKKLYLSSSGLKSNTSQVRFGCDSNSGAVLALILTSVNLFFLFSFSSF